MVHRLGNSEEKSGDSSVKPAPRKCDVPGCTYMTPESCSNANEQRSELSLHIDMSHKLTKRVNNPEEEENKRAENVNKLEAKLERPSVLMPSSDSQWKLFVHKWTLYREACKLDNETAKYQLYNTLGEELSLKV